LTTFSTHIENAEHVGDAHRKRTFEISLRDCLRWFSGCVLNFGASEVVKQNDETYFGKTYGTTDPPQQYLNVVNSLKIQSTPLRYTERFPKKSHRGVFFWKKTKIESCEYPYNDFKNGVPSVGSLAPTPAFQMFWKANHPESLITSGLRRQHIP